MEEEEDDFYAPNGETTAAKIEQANGHAVTQDEDMGALVYNDEDDEGDEDQEDDEDEDDSDIDIITERQDGAIPEPPPSARPFRGIKPELPRTASVDAVSVSTPRTAQPAVPKLETSAQPKRVSVSLKDGSKYPEVRSSSIDVNAIPVWNSAGKPITEVDIDADLAEHAKPWRLPGTDQTDYFNYGFDEFTWTQYCLRQQSMTSAINAQKQETKQFEMMLAGNPSAAAGPTPQAGGMGMPGMPAMSDMPPDMMNAMFASMQAQGVNDPSQLDFGSFMQQMQSMGGMPGPSGGQGGYGGQPGQQQASAQGFGGQQHPQSSFAHQQQGNQSFGGGTPQPQAQGQQQPGFEGYSAQQLAMMQNQGGGGPPQGPAGRGRGRGRRW